MNGWREKPLYLKLYANSSHTYEHSRLQTYWHCFPSFQHVVMQSHSVMAIHDPLQFSGMLVEIINIYIAANLNLTNSLHMRYIIQQNFKAFEKFLNLKDI